MLCKAILQEFGKQKACWLPADSNSYFGFCRRCHFDKVTELLDVLRIQYEHMDLPEDEPILQQQFFLEESIHKGREQAFLSLLNVLLYKKPLLFNSIIKTLRTNTRFQHLALKCFLCHPAGGRCALYKAILKKCNFYPVNTIHDLVGVCWHCLSWLFKKREVTREMPLFTMGFVVAIHEITPTKIQTFGAEPFLDILVSLHMYDRKLYAEELCERILVSLPPSERCDFLLRFLTQPPVLPQTLQKDIHGYLPTEFQTDEFRQTVYKEAFITIRNHQEKVKEELIAKTWHPDRFLQWCLDRTDFAWDI